MEKIQGFIIRMKGSILFDESFYKHQYKKTIIQALGKSKQQKREFFDSFWKKNEILLLL